MQDVSASKYIPILRSLIDIAKYLDISRYIDISIKTKLIQYRNRFPNSIAIFDNILISPKLSSHNFFIVLLAHSNFSIFCSWFYIKKDRSKNSDYQRNSGYNQGQFHGSAYHKHRIGAYGSRVFCAYGKRISRVSGEFLASARAYSPLLGILGLQG